jgi:hypothetical protein
MFPEILQHLDCVKIMTNLMMPLEITALDASKRVTYMAIYDLTTTMEPSKYSFS